MKSYKPFPETMQMLLEMEGISGRELSKRGVRHGLDLSHSTISRMAKGEVPAAPHHMESIARTLGILPETFAEYRLWQARRQYDPAEVPFETAIRNLRRLEEREDEDAEALDPAQLAAALDDQDAPGGRVASS